MSSPFLVRPFRPGDEETLPELWSTCLPADPISSSRLVDRILLDANFDPDGLLVAEAQARLIGFVLAIVRRVPLPGGSSGRRNGSDSKTGGDGDADCGWITAFGVRPEWRRQGVGRALLDRALGFLREHGRRQVLVSQYAPNYFVPGVDPVAYPAAIPFLTGLGFSPTAEVVAMDCDLAGVGILPADVRARQLSLAAEGVEFGRLTTRLLVPLLRFAETNFGADWAQSIRDGLLRGGPPERIIVAHRGDEILGYCMYGLYDRPVERFGPFGVHPSWRGRGIGKVLLHICLREMKGQGLHHAWFLSTGENSPAARLYRQLGFVVSRKFIMLQREL